MSPGLATDLGVFMTGCSRFGIPQVDLEVTIRMSAFEAEKLDAAEFRSRLPVAGEYVASKVA